MQGNLEQKNNMENKIRKAIREQIKNLKEDYKPSHRAYNVIDKSNNDKIVAKELSRDKALELAHTNKDYMISATDRLAEKGMSPEEWADAKEKERLNQHPEKDTINKIKQMMDKEKDEEQEEYDKGWYREEEDKEKEDKIDTIKKMAPKTNTKPLRKLAGLKETASKLGYLNETVNFEGEEYDILRKDGEWVYLRSIHDTMVGKKTIKVKEKDITMNEVDGMEGGTDLNAVSYEKVTFVYTEQGGRFYGLDVYENKDQDQRSAKLKYDEANEWLKDILAYIHEGDLIPRSYNSGLEDLDLIVERLEELGIEARHGDYMDVS